jgi:membrane fusion protein, multidrug efflux system
VSFSIAGIARLRAYWFLAQMTSQKPEVRPKKSRWWVWVIVLAGAGAGATYLFPRVTQATAKSDSKKGGKGDAGRAVPVVAAVARKGDVPVYVHGLGSVTAFNTVTVRTRVDGEIVKIAFTEGQMVKKDDPLVEIDPRPFQVMKEQAEAQLARDQALLANTRVDLERYKVLFAQQAVPKQQLDTQVATVDQTAATIKSDQAQIDNAKLQLVYAHITAPLTGRIGLRLVDQGNVVHATDATGLATITQLQPIAVIFNVDAGSLPQVMAKMRSGQTLPVYALDRDLKSRLASGRLLTIDNQIDQTTGTLKFKAQFENEDLSLFPNQFVDGYLLIDTKHNAVIIPTAAVQRSPQSTFVWVIRTDNTAEVRNISTGIVDGDNVSVTEGVQVGDRVVIDGIDKLQQDSRVTVRMVGAGSGG